MMENVENSYNTTTQLYLKKIKSDKISQEKGIKFREIITYETTTIERIVKSLIKQQQ